VRDTTSETQFNINQQLLDNLFTVTVLTAVTELTQVVTELTSGYYTST